MKNIVRPLSGRGKEIQYEYYDQNLNIEWGTIKFKVERGLIDDILKNYFVDKDKWYLLGACVDNPIKGGLGEYVTRNFKLTPRHASAIAAIMYDQKLITYRGKRPIEIKKL